MLEGRKQPHPLILNGFPHLPLQEWAAPTKYLGVQVNSTRTQKLEVQYHRETCFRLLALITSLGMETSSVTLPVFSLCMSILSGPVVTMMP